MFVDTAKIFVKGGDGGNGIVSYRREKFVPDGGPAGGDGGHGGDIIFVVDEGLRTLLDFKYQRHFKGERGEYGKTKNQHGANAENRRVKVPPGTAVRDDDTGEFLGDLVSHGQELVVARGGRGGRGNKRFATAANKAPDIAEKGEPGQERWLLLELKVLADVGLVGFPSVGKSTLLSVVSAAQPKIGDYHFTTISPNLGVVEVQDGRSFVLADLPGLIEGAHEGHGLGHQFLRHVERTKIILHVVDMAGSEGRDPFDDFLTISEELREYNLSLSDRPTLLVASKMDLPEAEEHLASFKEKLRDQGLDSIEIFPVSGVTRAGIPQLLYRTADLLDQLEKEVVREEPSISSERKVYRLEEMDDEFTITRDNEVYVVNSPKIEKLIKMTNFTQYDALKRFQRIMRQMGVDAGLRKRGASNGDIIRIGELEFEFVE